MELIQQVSDGSMSFDRTIKTGTAPLTTKGVIKKRMTENLKTVSELLEIDQKLFKNICTGTDEAKVTRPTPGISAGTGARSRPCWKS